MWLLHCCCSRTIFIFNVPWQFPSLSRNTLLPPSPSSSHLSAGREGKGKEREETPGPCISNLCRPVCLPWAVLLPHLLQPTHLLQESCIFPDLCCPPKGLPDPHGSSCTFLGAFADLFSFHVPSPIPVIPIQHPLLPISHMLPNPCCHLTGCLWPVWQLLCTHKHS